jgi:hypothetical protein
MRNVITNAIARMSIAAHSAIDRVRAVEGVLYMSADTQLDRTIRRVASAETFRADFSAALGSLDQPAAEYQFVTIPANRPPWTGTGIKLSAGDRVSLFCAGRAWLTAMPDAWVGANFSLWIRVGEAGPTFRAARGSLTFTAEHSGELFLANLFPAAWADKDGAVASQPTIFGKVAGAYEVLIVRWRGDPAQGLKKLADSHGPAAEIAAAELRALRNPTLPPSGWKYLFLTGDAECFSASGENGIRCEIADDASIMQKPAHAPFTPATRLRWSWKVEQLPSAYAEDSVAHHDYLSIAVEFDNGRDITYFWSSVMEPEHSFHCPVPSWSNRETHVVARSGSRELGKWIDEDRELWRDYSRAIGDPPSKIVAVWLIAVGIFQHGEGRCEYRNIEIVNGSEILRV